MLIVFGRRSNRSIAQPVRGRKENEERKNTAHNLALIVHSLLAFNTLGLRTLQPYPEPVGYV